MPITSSDEVRPNCISGHPSRWSQATTTDRVQQQAKPAKLATAVAAPEAADETKDSETAKL